MTLQPRELIEAAAELDAAVEWYSNRHRPLAVELVEDGEDLVILAYAHERKRPGYWRHRVRD
ncbi:hypothetical protein [Ornithinimicrobium faecis]|uniref:hypothetical protein n=1 Tax=Ornithinimicrobium faecis TaxID=2934158 RepID=UPI0021174424|nr:hypothetical protein [Ornithinimicrobium sp. HY1745]